MLAQTTQLAKRLVLRGGSPYYYARKLAHIVSTPNTYLKRLSVGHSLSRGCTPAERAVVGDLRGRGYHVLSAPFDHTTELVAACQDLLANYLATKPRQDRPIDKSKKFYWATLTPEEPAPDSIFIRYASQDSILRMAAEYLGVAPYLADISVQYSFQTGQDPTHSQLWHRDYADVRIFKIFVYCSDVDTPDDGAFSAADRRGVRGVYNTPLYSSFRFTDEQFFKIVSPADTKSICGPVGTTFICDTHNSFHFGSRCVNRPRLACWFTYISYAGLYSAGRVTSPDPNASEKMRFLLSKH
jgi:hypothetical protein